MYGFLFLLQEDYVLIWEIRILYNMPVKLEVALKILTP
jgi:hypothetical protein